MQLSNIRERKKVQNIKKKKKIAKTSPSSYMKADS